MRFAFIGANPAWDVVLPPCAAHLMHPNRHQINQQLVPVALGKPCQEKSEASKELKPHLRDFGRGFYLIKTNEQMTVACVDRGTALHDYTL